MNNCSYVRRMISCIHRLLNPITFIIRRINAAADTNITNSIPVPADISNTNSIPVPADMSITNSIPALAAMNTTMAVVAAAVVPMNIPAKEIKFSSSQALPSSYWV